MLGLFSGLGIDLGTTNIRIYARRRGIVVQEPSVVALDPATGKISAVGEKARSMVGKTPVGIWTLRPMKDGAIADYAAAEAMLKHFIRKVYTRRNILRPEVVLCISSGITDIERRAALEVVTSAGGRRIHLVDEVIAAALGAGLDISKPSGNLVVNLGGGTTTVATISLNSIVASRSLRIGGDKCDEAIVRYVKKTYNLLIGQLTAEEIKIAIGTIYKVSERRSAEVRGRDLVTGLPRSVSISSDEIYEALLEPISIIVEAIKAVLEETPPELVSDIADRGIILTGGGVLLHGLPRLLSQETGIPSYVSEDPINCVVRGAGRILESPWLLSEGLLARVGEL